MSPSQLSRESAIQKAQAQAMMIVHPTWIVKWTPPIPGTVMGQQMRVPEPDVDTMLRILRMNGVDEFSARRESDA